MKGFVDADTDSEQANDMLFITVKASAMVCNPLHDYQMEYL